MKNINQPVGDNLGGILRFNFADVNDIQTIADPINGKIVERIILKSTAQWYCGYGTLGTISYSEPSEIINPGTIYHVKFSASCPQDGSDNDDLFSRMRNKQFILDYTDSNGLRKLVGTIDEPLFFSAELDTKSNMPDLAGHIISFYADLSHKAPVYDI